MNKTWKVPPPGKDGFAQLRNWKSPGGEAKCGCGKYSLPQAAFLNHRCFRPEPK
jgi:hypothetical protein